MSVSAKCKHNNRRLINQILDKLSYLQRQIMFNQASASKANKERNVCWAVQEVERDEAKHVALICW